MTRYRETIACMGGEMLKSWILWIALVAGLCLLIGCASTPKGPCADNGCGVVCCNNDGRVCPACWEER